MTMQPPTQVTLINAPAPQPAVIINQNYTPDVVRPVMRDYTGEDSPLSTYQAPVPDNPEGRRGQVSGEPVIHLIALNDGAIYPALAYWLEGETLHYVTTKHSINRVSLSLVDIGLSERLNAERRVEFSLGRKAHSAR